MEDAYVLQLRNRNFSDFYLCFCGYAKCEPLHNFGPAVRPNYLIHLILEGKGKYIVDNNRYELEAGQGKSMDLLVDWFCRHTCKGISGRDWIGKWTEDVLLFSSTGTETHAG